MRGGEPKRFGGVDLEAIARGMPLPRDYVPPCPGAWLRVTGDDVAQMTRDGERFLPEPRQPATGYGYARSRCVNVVQEIPETTSGERLFYGLCSSCSSLEESNRATLAERARVASGGKAKGRQEAAE